MDEELRERRNRQTDETNKQTEKGWYQTAENKLDESVDGWTDGRAGEPEESRAKNQSASQPLSQPVSQSVSQSVGQSVCQSVYQLVSQSVSQLIRPKDRQMSVLHLFSIGM